MTETNSDAPSFLKKVISRITKMVRSLVICLVAYLVFVGFIASLVCLPFVMNRVARWMSDLAGISLMVSGLIVSSLVLSGLVVILLVLDYYRVIFLKGIIFILAIGFVSALVSGLVIGGLMVSGLVASSSVFGVLFFIIFMINGMLICGLAFKMFDYFDQKKRSKRLKDEDSEYGSEDIS